MAHENDHIALANANQETLLYLLNGGERHRPWAVTVAFYKAVHVVEAAFYNQIRHHSTSHDDRLSRLKIGPFASLYAEFSLLYNASRIARYLESSDVGSHSRFNQYMDSSAVLRFLRRKLYGVEQKLLPLLSVQARQNLSKFLPTQLSHLEPQGDST